MKTDLKKDIKDIIYMKLHKLSQFNELSLDERGEACMAIAEKVGNKISKNFIQLADIFNAWSEYLQDKRYNKFVDLYLEAFTVKEMNEALKTLTHEDMVKMYDALILVKKISGLDMRQKAFLRLLKGKLEHV